MSDEIPPDQNHWLHFQLAGAIAFVPLSISVVALRIIGIRLARPTIPKQSTRFGWDDGLLVASLPPFLALCACAIGTVSLAARAFLASYAVADPDDESCNYEEIIAKAELGFGIMIPIVCALPKLSICCLYIDLFRVLPTMRKIIYGLMVFIALNAVAFLIGTILIFWPSKYAVVQANSNAFNAWMSLPNVVTDVIMIALPLPVLCNMHLSRAKKFGLVITFLAASIGIFGGCLRLAYFMKATYVNYDHDFNNPREYAASWIASYVEPGMYLIAACLPRLRPLVGLIHNTLSTSLYPLFGRSRDTEGSSPPNGLNAISGPYKPGQAPKIDVKLTGKDALESLVREGEAIMTSDRRVSHKEAWAMRSYA